MLNLITSRLTPLALCEPAPSAEIIQRAIGAAEAAPDHGRVRPWRFILIESEARLKFGELMAAALKLRDPMADEAQLQKEREKPLRTPLIIVLAAEITPGRIPEIEQVLAAGAAAQNMQLAFHADGFGVQWKTGAACFDNHMKAGLGLPPSAHLIGFMYVGTIATPGRERAAHENARVRIWTGA